MPTSPIKIEHIGQVHAPPNEPNYIEDPLYRDILPEIYRSQKELFFTLLGEKRPVFGEGSYTDALQRDREFLDQNLRSEDYTNQTRLDELGAKLGKPHLVYAYALVKAAFGKQKYFDEFFTPDQQDVLLRLPAYVILWAIGGIPNFYATESEEANNRGASLAASLSKKRIIFPHEFHQHSILIHRDRDIYALVEIARRAHENPNMFSDVVIVFGNRHDFGQYITNEKIHVAKK